MLEGEAHVVRNKQVEVPITVVVKETASRSPAWRLVPRVVPRVVPKTGAPGTVGKRSIPVVAIETVLPEVSAEDILESVVVGIPDANPGSPPGRLQASLLRDIREGSVAVVLVEAIGGARRIPRQAR